ncbi:hypothetical protein AGMMS49942_16630 [Spirochaetia bacterium]|nr:hypothetical protein AGMMS49942_16630 [Spirochaetia bacterium]
MLSRCNKILFIISFTFLSIINVSAQQFTIGLKLTGLSIHPKGALNAHLMPYKLDKRAIFVINPGIVLSFEYFFYEDIASVKIEQAIYKDCCNQAAGFTHIGVRGRIFQIEKHSLNGGIGPTFIYRKNWYKLEGYNDAFDFFKGGDAKSDWQWRFIWWGGEFEYNYRLTETTELSFTIVPFIPELIELYFGTRVIINKHK